MAAQKKAPVERKIVNVSKGTVETVSTANGGVGSPKAKGSAGGLRIAAVVLWVLAILAEVAAILMLTRYIYIPEENLTTWLLVALGVDLVLVIVGSQLWKRANHTDPASKANKLKFWLWNNLGVIVSVVAFLPLLVLLLNDKKLDAKTKKLVSIVAAVALVLGVGASYDWNPVSQEEVAATQAQAESVSDGQVYWTMWGRKCHLYQDCSSLNYSETLYQGTMDEAVEAGRASLCKFCEGRADASEVALPLNDALPDVLDDTEVDAVDVNEEGLPDAA